MRIVLTCEDYFPHIGGAEICVYNLVQQLRSRGHTVTLFTNTVATTDDEEGIVRIRWAFTPLALWQNVHTLWKLIGQHDIVHCQYSFRLAAIAGVLARLRGRRMVLTQQGKGIVPEAGAKLFHSFLIKLCQHTSLRTASVVTSTSDEITDLTAEFVPRSKIHLISNGYDAERFVPDPSLPVPAELVALPQDVIRILSVRRLVPKNGIHIFVQALALLRERHTNFHYFAIGDGLLRPFIESLLDEYQLRNHVTLLGKMGNDTIVSYYQHADLVVVPSSAEARSIACIEAMGMEKPLIASRVGGLIDLLGKDSTYGELVSIYDSEACTYGPPDRLPADRLMSLVNALSDFLTDQQPLKAKAKLARSLVEEEYSWTAIVDRYLSLYATLPGRHRDS